MCFIALPYPTFHHHLFQLFADIRECWPLVCLLFPASKHEVIPAEEKGLQCFKSSPLAVNFHNRLLLIRRCGATALSREVL